MSVTETDEQLEERLAEEMGDDETGKSQTEQTGDVQEPENSAPPEADADAITPEEVERRFRSVKQSFRNYSGTVERNLDFMGERVTRCPLCKDDHPAFVDLADAGRYPQQLTDAVMSFLGFAREIEYKQDLDTG